MMTEDQIYLTNQRIFYMTGIFSATLVLINLIKTKWITNGKIKQRDFLELIMAILVSVTCMAIMNGKF